MTDAPEAGHRGRRSSRHARAQGAGTPTGAARAPSASSTPPVRRWTRSSTTRRNLYLYENALNPLRFPSLRQMEVEVVGDTAELLHAPAGAGGCMTSGGTESIVMAVKTARERAKAERGVDAAELVTPRTAHPAFAKAANYLGLELRADPARRRPARRRGAAAERADGRGTALVVGSAPNYPVRHGRSDPRAGRARRASAASPSTSTPASAASCCRSGSGSASPSRPSTSACPASARSPPTSTSTATA